jgi:hypothetical protein
MCGRASRKLPSNIKRRRWLRSLDLTGASGQSWADTDRKAGSSSVLGPERDDQCPKPCVSSLESLRPRPCVVQELLEPVRELERVTEGDAVPAVDLVGEDAEAFLGDPTHEAHRE